MDRRSTGKTGRFVKCLAAVSCLLLAAGVIFMMIRPGNTRTFKKSREAFTNPLMGYAPPADDSSNGEDVSLLYVDITWKELEPREGYFDWEGIARENYLQKWKREGKHLVLRFVCDIPGEESHMDIPQWLYEKIDGRGNWYDMEYGKGFSPDYENEVFIRSHEKAVKALGQFFGGSSFVSYVELGSLGHWGEWHVNYGAGIRRLPEEDVREQYILPWKEAFPNAAILMRRPFNAALEHGFGLYNDMAGDPDSTKEWLDWIKNGGAYEQTKEKKGLTAMEDSWKKAPIGGELTSSQTMEYMLSGRVEQTVTLIEKSHMTFLGPMTADSQYRKGYEEILKNLGYRFWISKAGLAKRDDGVYLELEWMNDGNAPMYQNWETKVYVTDSQGNMAEERKVDIDLTELLPGCTVRTSTRLSTEDVLRWKRRGIKICLGIIDPMTEMPSVTFAVKARQEGGLLELFG